MIGTKNIVIGMFCGVIATSVGCKREIIHRTSAARDTSNIQSSRCASKPAAFLDTVHSVSVETLRPTGPGIESTSSGAATKVIKRGTGKRHPTADDGVVLYLQVYDPSGHVKSRWDGFVGDPAKESDGAGWETLRMMVEGEVRRLWRPDPKSPGGVMVTDYELTWITPRPKDEAQPSTSTR